MILSLNPHSVMRVVRAQRTLSRFNVALTHSYKAEGRGQLKEGVIFSLWAGLPVSHDTHSPNKGQDGLFHFEGSRTTLFRTTRNHATKTPKKVKPETIPYKFSGGIYISEGIGRASKLNCFRRFLAKEQVQSTLNLDNVNH